MSTSIGLQCKFFNNHDSVVRWSGVILNPTRRLRASFNIHRRESRPLHWVVAASLENNIFNVHVIHISNINSHLWILDSSHGTILSTIATSFHGQWSRATRQAGETDAPFHGQVDVECSLFSEHRCCQEFRFCERVSLIIGASGERNVVGKKGLLIDYNI